jgi:hypothetical protein
MRNSIRNGHFGHLYGGFQRVRAIVQAGEDVTMNVDHVHSACSEDT